MAYAQIEPFGESRADLRAGVVSAVIANVNRSKDSKAFAPADFLPQPDTFAEPMHIADPHAQSDLLKRTLFGHLMK